MLLGELLKYAHDLIDDPHTNIPERLYEDLTGDAYYQLLLKREEPVEEALLMQYKDYGGTNRSITSNCSLVIQLERNF